MARSEEARQRAREKQRAKYAATKQLIPAPEGAGVETWDSVTGLFAQDCPVDLLLRGNARDEVTAVTGVDLGYNGRGVRDHVAAAGVDRAGYPGRHVLARVSIEHVEQLLTQYAQAVIGKEGMLAGLGLGTAPGVVRNVNLATLFAQMSPELGAQYDQAKAANQKVHRETGLDAAGGNPFNDPTVQARAAQTRTERYGAAYTFAKGSSLEATARASAAKTVVERGGRSGEAGEPAWRSATRRSDGLFTEGSVLDLVARGFTRKEILGRTGEDVGGRQAKAKVPLAGVDRFEYKAAAVRERCTRAEIEGALGLMAGGAPLGEVYEALGLGPQLPTRLCPLERLCVELESAHPGLVVQHSEAKSLRSRGIYREKVVVTNRQRFGVDNALQSPQLRAKQQATVRERYGVDNVSQDEGVKERKAQTSMQNYGAASFIESDAGQWALVQALRAKYGDEAVDAAVAACEGGEAALRPFMLVGVLEEAAAAVQATLGVRNVFAAPGVQAQIKATVMSKYGVDNVSRSPEVQRRRTASIRERYGVDNAFQAPELKEKAAASVMARYGVVNASQAVEIKEAKLATMTQNGTFCGSGVEDSLYELLIAVFGTAEVVRQHRDPERYPWACDFYVPSRDLFIELNGSWTHGGRWYDGCSTMDVERAAQWTAGSDYERNAVETWTVRDTAKREKAREHSLNYVVLWDGSEKLSDARLWIALGCPDGRDYEREHSWLGSAALDRDVAASLSAALVPAPGAELPLTSGRTVAAARDFNWRELYARELALWEADAVMPKSWGRTRVRLYTNRFEHMGTGGRFTGKLPHQLSDLEILRGLGIAGRVRAHTVFDNTAMSEVLAQHRVTSVYDPCAGWGERLVTCAARGIAYRGNDVNPAVVSAHRALIGAYGLDQSQYLSEVGDSARRDLSAHTHDAVITCPPYGSIEKYTEEEGAAENLSDEEFVAWWRRTVLASVGPDTRVWAFQINQRWKQQLTEAVLEALSEAGLRWRLHGTVALKARSSHRTRAAGGVDRKREFEEMVVLVRA